MTTQEFFKGAHLLHRVFVGGIVAIMLIMIYLRSGDFLSLDLGDQLTNLLTLVAVAYGFIGIFGSLLISNKMMKKASARETMSLKMLNYRKILLIRSATAEGAALLGTVAYLLTGSMICLGTAVICTAFLAFLKPGSEEAKKGLALSPSEALKLDSDDAVIVDPADWDHSKGF